MTDSELLAILACPICKGALNQAPGGDKPEGLLCPACAVVYPIQGGIRVLLKEEGVPLADWQAGARKRKV